MIIKSFVLLFSLIIPFTWGDDQNLFSWTIPSTVLPNVNHAIYAQYDASFNQDCIFLVGGANDYSSVYCYNITNDDIWQYGTLPLSYSSSSDTHSPAYFASAMIGSNFYYLTKNDGYIIKYDLNTTTKDEFIVDTRGTYGCLLKNRNNTHLYTVSGYNTNYLDIYDIDDDSLTSGPDLNVARYCPVCVVNEYC